VLDHPPANTIARPTDVFLTHIRWPPSGGPGGIAVANGWRRMPLDTHKLGPTTAQDLSRRVKVALISLACRPGVPSGS
jgi:hypothetical protein